LDVNRAQIGGPVPSPNLITVPLALVIKRLPRRM
jgi:hypothetical protein